MARASECNFNGIAISVENALEIRAATTAGKRKLPEILCDVCGKTAKQICTDCIYDDNGLLCDKCAESHACETELLLPVVNSPRCGVCAYEG